MHNRNLPVIVSFDNDDVYICRSDTDFDTGISEIEVRDSNYGYFSYRSAKDAKVKSKFMGKVNDLAYYDQSMFNNHASNILRGFTFDEEELRQEQERILREEQERMYDEQRNQNIRDNDVRMKKAQEEGEFWAELILAIKYPGPIPANLTMKVAAKIAKMSGITDLEVGNELLFAMLNKFQSYENANMKQIEEKHDE